MSLLTSWLASPLPDAAMQIAPECVSVAVLGTRGGESVVQGYAIEPLPAGAVTASLTGPNVIGRPAVVDALRRALDRAGVRPRRVAMVIPDPTARVSLVRFDQVPARHEDLDQLIRWQVRKAAPFPIEEASLTFDLSTRLPDGGAEFVVVMARREAIREYESVGEEVGMHAGLVDIATLSMLNLFLASREQPQDDWLIIHAQPTYTSVVILRGANVMFFRNIEGEDEGIADVVHQTTMYYQDRLAGQRFARVMLGGLGRTAGALDQMRNTLSDRLGGAVDMIDPTAAAALTDRISATPEVLSSLAPLIGVMVRARAETVGA
jgi:Tfp pilus assembly PilM family ATPase